MTKIITGGYDETFIEEYNRTQREQDRRPLAEEADPLALSWVAYHVWQKNPRNRWAAWQNLVVHEHDREMARATRKYYRDRLAMRALKSTQEMSQFSRDLYDICNGGIMRECHRGMLYRLPYFYVEDVAREQLIAETTEHPDVCVPDTIMERTTRQLLRWGTIFHSRRSRELMEYWFHDAETGYAVLWSVAYENPLRGLVDHYYNTTTAPRINALWRLGHDRMRDFRYWVVQEPQLRFE